MSGNDDDIAARINFLQISEETGGLLRDFWRVLGPSLPAILDGFYEHVTKVPALAGLVGNDIPRLQQAQKGHWERLFSGSFDEDYVKGVRTIGLTHNRIGLGGHNVVELARLPVRGQ